MASLLIKVLIYNFTFVKNNALKSLNSSNGRVVEFESGGAGFKSLLINLENLKKAHAMYNSTLVVCV